MNLYKFKHYYKNKYLLTPFSKRRFALSYNYKYKCLWFRTPKVGSRSINQYFLDSTPKDQYIYSSEVGYNSSDFKDWYKFAFVREPTDRFISCWKDKVLNRNFFGFAPEQYEEMKTLDSFLSWVEEQNIDEAEEHIRSQNALIDLDNLNFLGRLEDFESDMQKVADSIGMPLQKVHRKNTSGKKEVNLTELQRNRIAKIYAKDYELLYPTNATP